MTITAPTTPDLFDARCEQVENMSYYTGKSYTHEDGTRSFLLYDDSPWSPSDWDNLATVVQFSSRNLTMDNDDEGLREAWNHFDIYDETQVRGRYAAPEFLLVRWERAVRSRYTREDMMRRYLSIFRPEVLAFREWSHHAGGHGIAYVTEERRAMMGTPPDRVQAVMDAEVRTWMDYFNGEVYGVVAVTPTKDVIIADVTGSRVIGKAYTEDSCWGYYPDHEAQWPDEHRYACEEVAGSPIKD